MKHLIYIKVFKGYIEARTANKNNAEKFYSSGLNHPRSLAGDFYDVEKTFREAISKQPKVYFGLIRPAVLIHLIPEAEGGYTMLERKFFQEAAIGGGARKILLLDNTKPALQDTELFNVYKELEKRTLVNT